ncbi:MAG: cytochrome c maturation protein CcmE [Chlorobi bacterium]|nr:cytochrome c maturation protein CcmE [Chlorobiota bacterium]
MWRWIALIMLVVSGLVVASMMTSSSKYVSFEEAMSNPGKVYYVIGTFPEDPKIAYDPIKNPNKLEFSLVDKEGKEGKEVRVVYPGPKPQDFEKSEEVVVTGYWDEEQEIFYAQKVLLKCPSKYIDENASLTNN